MKTNPFDAGRLAAVQAALDQADTVVGLIDDLAEWLDVQTGLVMPWRLATRLHDLLAENHRLSNLLVQLPDPLLPNRLPATNGGAA